MIHIGPALLWGLFATGLLTLILAGSRGLGWTRMSFPFMLGSIVTANRRWATITGVLLHLIFGIAFAVLYAVVFEQWGAAGWWRGLLLGAYHGLFVLVVVMDFIAPLHPRMASRHQGPQPMKQLEPPGFMALNYGSKTPMITLAAHLVYGLILGLFYPIVG